MCNLINRLVVFLAYTANRIKIDEITSFTNPPLKMKTIMVLELIQLDYISNSTHIYYLLFARNEIKAYYQLIRPNHTLRIFFKNSTSPMYAIRLDMQL